jgi:hypothetical protein
MTQSLEPRIVHIDDDTLVDWTINPIFDFKTEVDALQMLQALGDELESTRKHLEHCMRYMKVAVRAARAIEEGGKLTSITAIANESGLTRQTVYTILEEG